jgi:hypothetical protein
VHEEEIRDLKAEFNVNFVLRETGSRSLQPSNAETYRDLEKSLVDSTSDTGDCVCSYHVTHCLHFGLPYSRDKHDDGGDDVDRSTSNEQSDRDEDNTANGERGHVRSVPVV